MSIGNHPDLKAFLNFIFPVIVLYGLYIQFNGTHGFGGGFQAGVLVASAFIARSMTFGVSSFTQVFSVQTVRLFGLIGVFLYGGVGILDMVLGCKFLSYCFSLDNPLIGQQIGSFLVEVGVFCTVSSSMLLIYLSFAEGYDK